MKRNDIFTFTAPNGVEVTAVCLDVLTPDYCQTPESETWLTKYLCYAQNKVFYYQECREIKKIIDDDYQSYLYTLEEEDIDYYYALKYHSHKKESITHDVIILVDYAILPDYDDMLQRYEKGRNCPC